MTAGSKRTKPAARAESATRSLQPPIKDRPSAPDPSSRTGLPSGCCTESASNASATTRTSPVEPPYGNRTGRDNTAIPSRPRGATTGEGQKQRPTTHGEPSPNEGGTRREQTRCAPRPRARVPRGASQNGVASHHGGSKHHGERQTDGGVAARATVATAGSCKTGVDANSVAVDAAGGGAGGGVGDGAGGGVNDGAGGGAGAISDAVGAAPRGLPKLKQQWLPINCSSTI